MAHDDNTAPTTATLTAYLKASTGDADFVAGVREEAFALVDQATAGATVPAVINALAVREVAADLYHRRRVRNGVAGFDGPDLTPVRVTRDPMKAAEDILRPYTGPGIS